METRLHNLLSKLNVDTAKWQPVLDYIYATDGGIAINEQPLFTRDLRYSTNKELNKALKPCEHVKAGALEAFHICVLGLTLSMRKQNPFVFEGVSIEELATVCLLCDSGKTGAYYPASDYGKERGIFWEYDCNIPSPQPELQIALAARYGISLTDNEYLGLRLAATPMSEEASKAFARQIKPWLLMVNGIAQVVRHNEFPLQQYANKVLAALQVTPEIELS